MVSFPNRTYRTGLTNRRGDRSFDLYRTDQEMTLLAGAPGFLPFHTVITIGDRRTVLLPLQPSRNGKNGTVFTSGSGHIPGIEGRLEPINEGETYLYTDNIVVNGAPAYPTPFEIGETLHLADVNGMETDIRFLVVTPRFSLVEFTDPRPYRS